MSKTDTIAAQKAALLAAQDGAIDAALGATWDQAALEQKGADGTMSQADVDAAVAAAQAVDQKAFDDAKAASDAAMTDLQAKLDAAVAAKSADETVLQGLQDAAAKFQAAADLVHSLFPLSPAV